MIQASQDIDQLCINTIRTLSMDAVQQATRDIPEHRWRWRPWLTVCGSTSCASTQRIPSGRIAIDSSCAWALLHAALLAAAPDRSESGQPKVRDAGQPSVPLDDIKRFRQLDSKCPGHPEYRWTSGVETTTGPLGQGVATSVGMAIAERWSGQLLQSPRV